eukprot:Hpha_TRINITY_DN10464_c0_g1::TRINITY_DN10464_c0_g1_i1::g.193510::m.193510
MRIITRPVLRRAFAAAAGTAGGWAVYSGPAHAEGLAEKAAAAAEGANSLWNRALAAADKDGDGNVSLAEAFTFGAEKSEKLARDVHAAIPWTELRELTSEAAVAVQQLQELARDAEKLVKQVHGILLIATRCVIEGSEAADIEELTRSVPAPVRPLLRSPPVTEVLEGYMKDAEGDADAACDKFQGDMYTTQYVAMKRAMMLVPGGMAITALIDAITDIRIAAFAAAAYGWDVKQASVQSQVLGCLAQVDMERVTQTAQLAKTGVENADEAVAYVAKVTDKLDQGLQRCAEQAGSLQSRLYDARNSGDEVADQVAQQVATKLLMMLKERDQETLMFAKQLFHSGPRGPHLKRGNPHSETWPTWKVAVISSFWSSACTSALCVFCCR